MVYPNKIYKLYHLAFLKIYNHFNKNTLMTSPITATTGILQLTFLILLGNIIHWLQ